MPPQPPPPNRPTAAQLQYLQQIKALFPDAFDWQYIRVLPGKEERA
jgi:hypothetical protein